MSEPESTPPPPPSWATELPAEDPLPGWRESTPTPSAPPSRGTLPRNDEPNYQPLRRADRPRGLLVSPSLHGPAPFDAIELELEPEIEDEPIEELLTEKDELDREYDAAEALIEEIAAENEAAEAAQALEEEAPHDELEVAYEEEPTPASGMTTVETAPEIAPAEVEPSEPEREGGWAPETEELEDVSSEEETSPEVAEPEASVETETTWDASQEARSSELTEAPRETAEDQADEPREPTASDREESADEEEEDGETSKSSG